MRSPGPPCFHVVPQAWGLQPPCSASCFASSTSQLEHLQSRKPSLCPPVCA